MYLDVKTCLDTFIFGQIWDTYYGTEGVLYYYICHIASWRTISVCLRQLLFKGFLSSYASRKICDGASKRPANYVDNHAYMITRPCFTLYWCDYGTQFWTGKLIWAQEFDRLSRVLRVGGGDWRATGIYKRDIRFADTIGFQTQAVEEELARTFVGALVEKPPFSPGWAVPLVPVPRPGLANRD